MEDQTLRDAFAMAALSGLLSGAEPIDCREMNELGEGNTPRGFAIASWQFADAMLAEREKQND